MIPPGGLQERYKRSSFPIFVTVFPSFFIFFFLIFILFVILKKSIRQFTHFFHSQPVPLICSVCELDSFESTYKRLHTVFVFLGLTYFTKSNVLKARPCCFKWRGFIFLWLSNIPFFIDIRSALSIHPLMDT